MAGKPARTAALQASTLAWQENERLARQEGPKSKCALMPRTLATRHGRALWRNGQPAEALAVVAQGLSIWKASRGSGANPGADVRWSQLQALHGALLAEQGKPGAETALREALARLQPHFADANVGRPARLAWAEAAASLLLLKPADALTLRCQALQALDEAARAIPLAADHVALRSRLST